jgi:5-methylcytosine-specific restriction endonuclease McrA
VANVENNSPSDLPPFYQQLYDAFIAFGVGKGVTLEELRKRIGCQPHEQQQLRRRISDLKLYGYDARRIGQKGRVHLYALMSDKPTHAPQKARSINQKIRAQVLNSASGRCQMCGATIEKDRIKLVVDHKIPVEWGGGDDSANLWAICEPCNGGKRDFFKSFDADLMRQCMSYPEEPKRIGELLKAFGDDAPPRYLLALVAGGAEWTKRLRQLRLIGWNIEKLWSKEEGNWTYRLIESQPWPENLWKAIKEAEETPRTK